VGDLFDETTERNYLVSKAPMGRLEQIDLREIWKSEATDFTPWLAQEEHLKLLGEAIDIELELEAQEKNVGPFRADILCKDIGTAAGEWVLIENQLERTDHTHLGQLMTYAAGLKAVTIVWIADRFTEEHRAALDWLNDITDDRFNFFGLEVQLWKIGDSPIAPKFNVVCKPNDWSRTVLGATKKLEPGELTDTNALYLEYWTALKAHLETSNSIVRMGKPQAQMWMTFPVGRSNFYLSISISKTKRHLVVHLVIYGADHVAFFRLLENEKEEIEREMGCELRWRELPDGKESQVRCEFPDTDPTCKSDWFKQHDIILGKLEDLHRVFSPRVKDLDLSQYEATEQEANA